jgi:hypothetical protein
VKGGAADGDRPEHSVNDLGPSVDELDELQRFQDDSDIALCEAINRVRYEVTLDTVRVMHG